MSVKLSPAELSMTNLTWPLDPSHCLHFSHASTLISLLLPSPITHLFLPPVSPVHSPGLYHSQCMFRFTVSCTRTRIFKLLPHLTSSTSLCLSSPVILPSPNHPPASLFLLSLFLTPHPSHTPALVLADN